MEVIMMKSTKLLLRLIGFLILLATLTFGTGSSMLESAFDALVRSGTISGLENQFVVGSLLQFVCAAAVMGVGVLLYPVLMPYNVPVALGHMAFRVVEGVILMVGVIGPLMLVALPDVNQTFREVAWVSNQLAFHLAMLALGSYSVILCVYLFNARLLPRWISAAGAFGYVALSVNSVMEFMGISLDYTLFLPGALFEIVFPLWIIFKGFDFTYVDRSFLSKV
jgi:hypothetical protein